MDEAERLSDRIAIIDHGKVLVIDTPEKLKEKSGMGDLLQICVRETDEAQARKLLNALPSNLSEKRYSEGVFYLGAEDLLELIPVLRKIFSDCGLKVEDMTIRKRTLEDAFISMTGRGLRE
jgi:ABC-2 type transport system ATP-binding protein